MEEVRSTIVLVALLFVSTLGHAVVWAGLGLLPSVDEMLRMDAATISLEVAEPEREPELDEPEPEPEPEVEETEPEPVVEREPRERPTVPDPEPQPEPEAEEPPPAEEAIADFTGETLTNDEGEAWNSATGNGAVMEGPVGQPGAQVTGRRRTGVRGGVPGGRGEADEGPRLVAVSDLSRRPSFSADRIRRLIQDNYPRRARDLGLEGDAVVRIRVSPDGRVQPLAVVREDHDEMGEACRRVIRASGRWEPPLDRSGEAVATITTFRCGFAIRF